MSSRRSLKINQKAYKHILSSNFKHKYYFSAFNSLRRQDDESPTLHDFSRQTETFQIELPYPVSSPKRLAYDGRDHCLDLLTAKANYDHKIHQLLYSYKQDKKWLTKQYVTTTKYAKLPKYMIDLCTGQISDPDKYFSGDYDWYYSGGALDLVEIEGNMYFLHPDLENRLCLTYSEDTSKVFPLEGITKAMPIYYVKAYADVIAVRQKNMLHLLQLFCDANGLSVQVLSSKESKKVPYIDVKCLKNVEACIVDLNRKLRILNLETNSTFVKHEFAENTELNDNFMQVDYCSENDVVFLDRNTIGLVDKRSLTQKVFNLKNYYFKCDNLSGLLVSKRDCNYLFACSSHNIIKIDLREMRVVKKWSHLLAGPPLMIQSVLWGAKEIIFVSAQNYAERAILCSDENEPNLVQVVPNNSETLRQCDLTCNFNLGEEFRDRIKFSTCGINIQASTDGSIDLYASNCNGDIFKSSINKSFPSNQSFTLGDCSRNKLNKWIQGLPKRVPKLSVTGLCEMSKWKLAMTEAKCDDSLAVYEKANEMRVKLLTEMEEYESDLTAIWQADKSSVDGSLVPSDETTPGNKVTEWLQSANNGHIHSDDESVEDAFVL